jgi:hypothetical protein
MSNTTTRKSRPSAKPRSPRSTRKNRPTPKTDYVVAIPTYNRSDVLERKTLTTLHEGHVPPSKIYIFVANPEEQATYEAQIPRKLYHKMVVGKLGISNQRQFISDYFPPKTCIVSLDDDIEGLYRRQSPQALSKITNLDTFFRQAFTRLHQENLYLWGVYPVCNPFFMKPNTTTKLRFIIGALHGYINRPDAKELKFRGKSDQKEDYEQSIQYFLKDGGVVRFNDVSIKTKFHAPGGLGRTQERLEANEKAARYLETTYPELVRVFHRKNGMAEVRLANVAGPRAADEPDEPDEPDKP